MKLTTDQRRERIHKMMAENPDFMRMEAAYSASKTWFDKFTGRLPGFLRSRLLEYPGMMVLMHRRMIDAVCKNMRFPDED